MPSDDYDHRQNIYPALRYRDSKAMLDWLGAAFGFETRASYPAPDGAIAHAELSFGPGTIMVGTAKEGTDNPWGEWGQGLYVYVEDVDAHYRRAKAAGAEIVRDLSDTDYGAREYSARDPEGHLWSFGTYRPE